MDSLSLLKDFITNYWSFFILIICLFVIVTETIEKFKGMSEEQRIEALMKLIKELIIKLMADAEINWSEITKSGKIKRAEVISEVYKQYPILSTFKDQEAIIAEIDKMIDEAVDEVEKFVYDGNVSENQEEDEE